MLPGSPDDPQPLMRKGFFRFSEEEKFILRKRLERDGKEKKKGAQGKNIPLKGVWRTLKNYRRWLHYLATACVFSTWSPLTTYTPSIIMYVYISIYISAAGGNDLFPSPPPLPTILILGNG